MLKVILVAKIKVIPAHLEVMKEALLSLVAPTLQEEGCIKYDLHQDENDPTTFIFLEEWASLAHLQAHSQSPHIVALGPIAKGKIETRDLYQLKSLVP